MIDSGMMETLCYFCEYGIYIAERLCWGCSCPGTQRPKGYVIKFYDGELGKSGYCQHLVGSIMVYEDVE